jgi:hypothetical protein
MDSWDSNLGVVSTNKSCPCFALENDHFYEGGCATQLSLIFLNYSVSSSSSSSKTHMPQFILLVSKIKIKMLLVQKGLLEVSSNPPLIVSDM